MIIEVLAGIGVIAITFQKWIKLAIFGHPSALGMIGCETLRELLIKEYKGKPEECYVEPLDSFNYIYRLKDFIRFTKLDELNSKTYEKDKHDCENFSREFVDRAQRAMPLCLCGQIRVDTPDGKHSLNLFIDEKRLFWLYEPQTDNVFKLPSDWKPYYVEI